MANARLVRRRSADAITDASRSQHTALDSSLPAPTARTHAQQQHCGSGWYVSLSLTQPCAIPDPNKHINKTTTARGVWVVRLKTVLLVPIR